MGHNGNPLPSALLKIAVIKMLGALMGWFAIVLVLLQEIEEFIADDPYVKNGLVPSW